MQLTLHDLAQALAPIEQIGKGEITFDVNGTSITLRRLLPEEENEVQKFAMSKDGAENTIALDYMERFKLGLLSYALVAIGNLDLRDAAYVETGEVLGNGKPVKLPRHLALRQMLALWASPLRLAMFRKYVELLNQVEKQAEAAIEFDEEELDDEIERLESRLSDLKERRETDKESKQSDIDKMTRTIAEGNVNPLEVVGAAPEPEPETPVQAPEPPVQAPAPTPPPQPVARPQTPVQTAIPAPRRSPIPQAMAPVAPQSAPVQQPVRVQQQPAPQAQPPQDQPQHYVAGMDVPDSFVDMSDSMSMDEAIQAENLRMFQQRQAAMYQQESTPSVLSQVHQARRMPPHVAARQVEESMGDPDADFSDESRYLPRGRMVDGVEAFQMTPPEEMSVRRAPMPFPNKATPKSHNPHFQPPKKI